MPGTWLANSIWKQARDWPIAYGNRFNAEHLVAVLEVSDALWYSCVETWVANSTRPVTRQICWIESDFVSVMDVEIKSIGKMLARA